MARANVRRPKPLNEAAWLSFWARVLRETVSVLVQIERDRSDIRRDTLAGAGRSAEVADQSASSEWWRYYEMPEWRHFLLAAFHMGLLPDIARASALSVMKMDLTRYLFGTLAERDIEPRSPSRALGSAWSLGNSVRAWVICGRTLNELVAAAANDDDTLRLAIRIDPTALYCSPIRRRFLRAVAGYDGKFLASIGEALRDPKPLQSEQYPELQACLYLLHRARQLDVLNEARAARLFLEDLADLKLYQGDRRSLTRYVQRFREKLATEKR